MRKSPDPERHATLLTIAELTHIYVEMRPKLERVILSRIGRHMVAEELAQHIFMRIHSIKAKLETRQDAENYFVRVAINAATDYVRIENRRQEILTENRELFQGESISPEQHTLARDEYRRIEEALAELPPKCRQVLIMSRFEGFTHREIAGKLGVSESLVEKYVARALSHCRTRLSRDAD